MQIFILELSQVQFELSCFKSFQEVPATVKYEQLYAPNIVEIHEPCWVAMYYPSETPLSVVH